MKFSIFFKIEIHKIISFIRFAIIFSLTYSNFAFISANAESGSDILARDFVIGNICLDKAGHPLFAISPIDGNPQCVATRDFLPGEKLTYHHTEINPSNPMQRRFSDSFSIITSIGEVFVHTYDFHPEGTFVPGTYDTENQIGGGTITLISKNTLSFAATQLGKQNLQFFVGSNCHRGQALSANSIIDSWVLAPLDQLASIKLPDTIPADGQIIANGIVNSKSRIVDGGVATCPVVLGNGSTRWSIQPITYPAIYKYGAHKGQHVRLWTLIAERVGKPSDRRDLAQALERAYFTRELGWTRWEAWKTTKAVVHGRIVKSIQEMADHIKITKRCDLPDSSGNQSSTSLPIAPLSASGRPRSDMLLAACLDMTGIEPPSNLYGDQPPDGDGTWFSSIKKYKSIFEK